ncbi:MAG TPA: sterol desaturase family protein [Gemmataceae bacterium]|nr:sterol desaturase family protein [Gemmataceae bacterium]
MDLTWSQLAEWAARPTVAVTAVAFLAFALVLSPLERLWPARPQPVRRRGFGTDLVFWMFNPLVGKAITFVAVTALAAGLFALAGREFSLVSTEGWGPVGRQPLWLQAVEVLLLADLIFYWAHRGFHTSRLWPFHAVHHSATEMDWLTSMRFHPVNDVLSRVCQAIPLVLFGFAPAAVVCMIPVVVVFIVVTHANLPWTWGPLKYVFVSPVYHHWHHSTDRAAVDTNFAGVLVLWDWLFGTMYLPADRRPHGYGVAGGGLPSGPAGLLAYPFAELARGLVPEKAAEPLGFDPARIPVYGSAPPSP